MEKKTQHQKEPPLLAQSVRPTAYRVRIEPDLVACTYDWDVDVTIVCNETVDTVTMHYLVPTSTGDEATGDGESSNKTKVRAFWCSGEVLAAQVDKSLDFARLGIDACNCLNEEDTKEKAMETKFNSDEQTVTFSFAPNTLSKGTIGHLLISGHGVLNDSLAGFYRSSYTDSFSNERKYMGVTQFEATDARRAFPCFDEPAIKATFEVSLCVAAHLNALSNMNVIERRSIGTDKVIVRFARTPIMSTYLLAFIIGEFDRISTVSANGVLTSVYTPRGKSGLGQHALNVASKALPFFEEQFGVTYPLPKSDLLAIPDFAAGAMENWGCVTYRETRLLIDPARSTLVTKTRCTRTVCHELAHMWFGNLVTMQWWTHLWLNEGFARFMEFKAVNHVFPEWNIWTQFLYSVQGLAFDRDAMDTTHPIEVPVCHPSEIDNIFDVISYAKGASVLRMLHEFIGEDVFMRGIKIYLQKHQYSNAVTEQLWASIDEAVANVNGAKEHLGIDSIEGLMNTWVKKPGFPVVNVGLLSASSGNSSTSDASLNVRIFVEQQRFQSKTSASESASGSKDHEASQQTTWQIPLKISINGGDQNTLFLLNTKQAEILVDLPSESCTTVKTTQTPWININSNRSAFFRVNYSPQLLSAAGDQVLQGSLGPADRLSLISDAFACSAAGLSSVTHVLKYLVPCFRRGEQELSVLQELRDGLTSLLSVHAGDDLIIQYIRRLASGVFAEPARQLGWQPKEGEPSTDAVKRAVVLGVLVTARDDRTLKECHLQFNALPNDELPPELLGLTCIAAVRHGGKPEYERVLELHSSSGLAAERRTLCSALGASEDPRLIERTLEWTVHSGHVRQQDMFVPFSAVARADRKRVRSGDSESILWKWLEQNYDVLQKITSGGKILSQIVNSALAFMQTEKDQQDVIAFFDARPGVATRLDSHLEAAKHRHTRQLRERTDLQTLAEAQDAAILEFWDPHFHIWDVTRSDIVEKQLHDPDILFSPAGRPNYDVGRYESEFMQGGFESLFLHTGGVFVEAMSVCFPDQPGDALNARCILEGQWASSKLVSSPETSKKYSIVASACLEAPNASATLQKLVEINGIVGIRQILNKDPSWPRNKEKPDLLEDEAWLSGFAALAATKCLSFDCQCNPSQFANAAKVFAKFPDTMIVINHLGCFTAENLTEEKHWEGLARLAALPQVHVKLSMLCYAHKDWDAGEGRDMVYAAVQRVCALFGEDRVFFASNYPVDAKDGWAAGRLFPAFYDMARELKLDLHKVFSSNAKRVYKSM